jgi:hypothetical protein
VAEVSQDGATSTAGGKGVVSGLGEAALDRALADASIRNDWRSTQTLWRLLRTYWGSQGRGFLPGSVARVMDGEGIGLPGPLCGGPPSDRAAGERSAELSPHQEGLARALTPALVNNEVSEISEARRGSRGRDDDCDGSCRA